MEQLYCMNCLRETPSYPCPLCGYDPAHTPEVPQALEQSILHGRYLTGRALEKNNIEIIYKGLDLAKNSPVTVWEFFPAGQAARQEGGSLAWSVPQAQSPEAMLARIRQQIPGREILDSFPENGTVYVICKPAVRSSQPSAPPRRKENEWLPFLLALLVLALASITLAPWIIDYL